MGVKWLDGIYNDIDINGSSFDLVAERERDNTGKRFNFILIPGKGDERIVDVKVGEVEIPCDYSMDAESFYYKRGYYHNSTPLASETEPELLTPAEYAETTAINDANAAIEKFDLRYVPEKARKRLHLYLEREFLDTGIQFVEMHAIAKMKEEKGNRNA